MQGRKLILADGTEYDEGECGYSEGNLWCYLKPGTPMADVFRDFSDPGKTGHITFVYGVMSDEYRDFTDFRGMMLDGDGNLRLLLRKETANNG